MNKMLFIKGTYWLGIGADALWAVGLFFPSVFALLVGRPDFNVDLQVRLAMGVGGSLMIGWTFLLFWAVLEPIERRGVLLLTACPVIVGIFTMALLGVINGNTSSLWILAKTFILFIAMLCSYYFAWKMDRQGT
ncbi:MAG: hypothetical protein JSW04_09745 [Desulfobacterales bacterium]|jgi:hypothetical protein|nr:MAG: hypothetical protein JSW04_09745 [Desulfobacterales bacterium]